MFTNHYDVMKKHKPQWITRHRLEWAMEHDLQFAMKEDSWSIWFANKDLVAKMYPEWVQKNNPEWFDKNIAISNIPFCEDVPQEFMNIFKSKEQTDNNQQKTMKIQDLKLHDKFVFESDSKNFPDTCPVYVVTHKNANELTMLRLTNCSVLTVDYANLSIGNVIILEK